VASGRPRAEPHLPDRRCVTGRSCPNSSPRWPARCEFLPTGRAGQCAESWTPRPTVTGPRAVPRGRSRMSANGHARGRRAPRAHPAAGRRRAGETL